MLNSNQSPVTLSGDDLNELDRRILNYMHVGRATPTLIRRLLERDAEDEDTAVDEDDVVSRQYINQRMKRLAEHEHIENLLDTGVYELRGDPREDGDNESSG